MEAVLMTVTAVLALGFQEFHAALGFFIAGSVTAAVGGGAVVDSRTCRPHR